MTTQELIMTLRTMVETNYRVDTVDIAHVAADELARLSTERDNWAKVADQYCGDAERMDIEIGPLRTVLIAARYVQRCLDRGCHSMETVPDLRDALAAYDARSY